MTDEKLAEIKARAEAATPGYWMAGEHDAVLRKNTEDWPIRVVTLQADSPDDVAALTHSYADRAVLLAEVERLRAREVESHAQGAALQKEIAELQGVIAVLERRADVSGAYHQRLTRRLADAMWIVQAMATLPDAYNDARSNPNFCLLCDAEWDDSRGGVAHAPDCPVTKARALADADQTT